MSSSLNSTLGVLEIGILISGVLFGVVTTQVYVYHKNFPKDSLWLQIGLVDGMWLIELGHTMCIFHAIYFYTVANYGDPKALLVAPVTLGIAVVLHGITTILVQAYFTYRIFRFSKKPYLIPIFSTFLMFAQLLAVTTLSAEAIKVAQISLGLYLEKWEWLLLTTLWLRVAADLTISSSLVFFLYQQRDNAYKSTVLVVDRLIRWTIETGVITSMLGIILVISYLTAKENFAWLALFMVLPKVFSNTLLANMNSRASLRTMQTSVEVSGTSGPVTNRSRTLATGMAVSVHTEMDTFDISRGGNWTIDSTPDKKYESV
ncbi:hypothetical protein EV368DRAFT_85926 [Lentinula lateritia]|uniref:Uncharacterized protein n=1 Tax=Lentinula aff. lateritia TaxID=2804960 RepID=A0ACC1TR19_9AGAR|nr:hypothetical protein F5876DRAFT_79928 [Lentinula aff. lateritia]KAJ3849059.1 hypothetical protein EV368DRAFT_85926 [Lentinula lateritia]